MELVEMEERHAQIAKAQQELQEDCEATLRHIEETQRVHLSRTEDLDHCEKRLKKTVCGRGDSRDQRPGCKRRKVPRQGDREAARDPELPSW